LLKLQSTDCICSLSEQLAKASDVQNGQQMVLRVVCIGLASSQQQVSILCVLINSINQRIFSHLSTEGLLCHRTMFFCRVFALGMPIDTRWCVVVCA
jgi:hypothetical protein